MSDSPRPDLGLRESTGCSCHDTDADVPALDARQIPHALRHATIFGAVDGLAVGAAFDLIAPHDPLPLLAQLADREGDAVSYDYRERGPQAWVLRLTRRA